MKKLLIDINSVIPYYATGRMSGIGRTTQELVETLSIMEDIPFEISLYSQNMKGISGKNMNTSFSSHHIYFPHRKKWNKVLSHFPVREWAYKYDLMHIPHNFEYVYNPHKCIVTLHDAFFMKIEEKKFGHAQMRKEVPPFIKKCKHIITCSEYSKKDIVETMQISPDKIDVIYWGIRHDQFYPTCDNQESFYFVQKLFGITKPYFLGVSCNAERKRSHVLIQAYMELSKQQEPKHDLVLVWSEPPFEILRKVEQSNVSKNIHFLSGVTNEALRNLYQAATASFNPSSYEGFGLPVLEAMACGTPAVTCRNSSLPEVGGNAALYLNEPVLPSLVEMMLCFENNSLPLMDIRKAGLTQAAKFTWEQTARKTLAVYIKNLIHI